MSTERLPFSGSRTRGPKPACEVLRGTLAIHRQIDDWILGSVGDDLVRGKIGAGVSDGDEVEVAWKWKNTQRWGQQREIVSIRSVTPSGEVATLRYLAKNFPGVGPTLARALWENFDDSLWTVLDEEDLVLLTKVKGISKNKAVDIFDTWIAIQDAKECDMFFEDAEITVAYQKRIFRAYLEDADQYETLRDIPVAKRKEVIESIEKNPYGLIEKVDGIAFKKADAIAVALKLPKDSPHRMRAGVIYAMDFASQIAGHTRLLESACAAEAKEQLCPAAQMKGMNFPAKKELDHKYSRLIDQAIRDLIAGGSLVSDGEYVALKKFHDLECEIAERVRKFSALSDPCIGAASSRDGGGA